MLCRRAKSSAITYCCKASASGHARKYTPAHIYQHDNRGVGGRPGMHLSKAQGTSPS